MPINHYLCQTYEEPLDSQTAFQRCANLYSDFPTQVQEFYTELFKRCDAIPLNIALVDGALTNTPVRKSRFVHEFSHEWIIHKHQGISLIPYRDRVAPATPLIQCLRRTGERCATHEIQHSLHLYTQRPSVISRLNLNADGTQLVPADEVSPSLTPLHEPPTFSLAQIMPFIDPLFNFIEKANLEAEEPYFVSAWPFYLLGKYAHDDLDLLKGFHDQKEFVFES